MTEPRDPLPTLAPAPAPARPTTPSYLAWGGAILGAALALTVAFVGASGCAEAKEGGEFASLPIEPDASTPPPSSEGGFGESDSAPPLLTGECEEETKQIFVLATDKGLYRFHPDTLKFVHIGQLACPTSAGTFSMGIDRRGTAWVEFTDGRLYAVDTRNGSCKATAFRPGQTGFETFGMGFARNGDTPGGETLYVAGAGLAALDTQTFQLAFLGSLTYGRTELTGMDTDLYAFSVGSGVIAGLDKATAATKKVYRSSAVDEQAAFAFAQWGGEFWLFTGTTTTKVTRYIPTTDESIVAVENTGMLIVGAGSSTCAPSKRPN